MNVLKVVAVAGALLAAGLFAPGDAAQARSGFSFGYSGPGVDLYIGKYPRYRRYYGPYYYPPPYYHRPYVRRPGRCAYWSRQCARNWGYGGGDYYGCLRYHRCY